MSSQKPLQAKVEFASTPTFSDFQAKNPDFPSWSPPEKQEIANKFFTEKVRGFKPEEVTEARSAFNQKYSKDLGFELGNTVDPNLSSQPQGPLDFLGGVVGGLAQAGSSLIHPGAFSGIPTNEQEARKILRNTFQQYTPPVGNQTFNTGANIGSSVGNFAKYALGGALGPIGTLGISANDNLQRSLNGQQNLGQAAYNTVLDTALAKLAPNAQTLIGSALKNAGIGAAGGALGAAGNQILSGQGLNALEALEAAKQSAIEGGAIGAGFHAANARPAAPQIQQAPVETQVRQLSPERLEVNDFKRKLVGQARTVKNLKSTTQESTLSKKISSLKKQYENLSQVSNMKGAPEAIKKTALRAMDSQKREFERLSTELKSIRDERINSQRSEGLSRKEANRIAKERAEAAASRQNQRKALDKVIDDNRRAEYKRLAAEEKRLVSEQKEAVKAQKLRQAQVDKIQNLKDRQAVKDRIALEKAEGQKRAEEIKRLRASMQANAKEQALRDKQTADGNKALEKAEQQNRDRELRHLKAGIKENNNPTEENPLKAEVTNDTVEQHRENLQKAIDAGKPVRLEYRAERAGSRDESTFRQKTDLPYELGSDSSGEYVRVINENGKFSKRYLDSIQGSVSIHNERFPFTMDNEGVYAKGSKKGQRGRARVLDEDGMEVDQSARELTKDSVIQGNIEKMQEAINRAKQGKASVREILDASKGLEATDMAKAFESLPQKARAELHEKITGEPC